MDPKHASLPRRVTLAFLGLELLFKPLVGYSYLDVAGAHGGGELEGWPARPTR